LFLRTAAIFSAFVVKTSFQTGTAIRATTVLTFTRSKHFLFGIFLLQIKRPGFVRHRQRLFFGPNKRLDEPHNADVIFFFFFNE
jgi:hypothetical protein